MKQNKNLLLLNLVGSVIGIIIWVMLLFLAIIVHVKLGDEEYTYGNTLGLNWAQGPVENLESENLASCPIGSTYGLVNTFFPGFKTGCYCKPNSYYSGYCGLYQNRSGCVQFPESSPKLIVSWGGSLCTNRPKNTTYFTLNSTNSYPLAAGVKCSNETKSCGVLDTLGAKLCINKEDSCPINYLKVVNENATIDNDFNTTELLFADGHKKFVYSNLNPNGQVVNQFLISDHKPCADSAENKIELVPSDTPYECKRKIQGHIYDPSWVLLDTMKIEELVADNHLTSQLSPYPFWNSIKSRPVGLYYRSYIGLNSTCLQQAIDYIYPNSINSIPQIFLNMKQTLTTSNIDFISMTSITIYLILLSCLILKIILSMNNSKYSLRLYVNISAAFCSILLLIVAIVSTINISNARNQYIWFYNNPQCSDPINQGLLYLFDDNIKQAYFIAVVFTIGVLVLFFTIILEYLLSHCYEESENEDQLDESIDSDSSRLLSLKSKKDSKKGGEIEMKDNKSKSSKDSANKKLI
jgi:hypothetical protein